jgi:hypothetical protein
MTDTPLEDAYDEHISPLMAQIIELCKTHKIPMVAQFLLDDDEDGDPLRCTTSLLKPEWREIPEVTQRAANLLYHGEPASFLAVTIHTGEKPAHA